MEKLKESLYKHDSLLVDAIAGKFPKRELRKEEKCLCDPSQGRNLLHLAAASGTASDVATLIETGGMGVDSESFSGRSALHYALTFNEKESRVVEQLLKLGASFDDSEYCDAALSHASLATLMLLLEKGAPLDLNQALLLAAGNYQHGHDITPYLYAHYDGSALEKVELGSSSEGETALLRCASRGSMKTFEFLVNKGFALDSWDGTDSVLDTICGNDQGDGHLMLEYVLRNGKFSIRDKHVLEVIQLGTLKMLDVLLASGAILPENALDFSGKRSDEHGVAIFDKLVELKCTPVNALELSQQICEGGTLKMFLWLLQNVKDSVIAHGVHSETTLGSACRRDTAEGLSLLLHLLETQEFSLEELQYSVATYCRACSDVKGLDAFIAKGISLSSRDDRGDTLLSCAAGNTTGLHLVKRLLAARCNVNARSASGVTPIMECAQLEAMRLLIDAGADTSARDYEDNTLLMKQLETSGDLERRLHFLVDGLHVTNVNALNCQFENALSQALRYSQSKIVHFILGLPGLDTKCVMTDEYASSFDLAALHSDDMDVVKLLMRQTEDINAANASGETALYHLVSRCDTKDAILAAIEAGADPKVGSKRDEMLAEAVMYQPADVVSKLLEKGMVCERTVAGKAYLAACEECVDINVLDLIADSIEYKETDQTNALMKAARRNSDLVIAYLLDKQCIDVNAQDDDGNTALSDACDNGAMASAIRLLKAGAKVTGRAIGNACSNGQLQMLQLLFEHIDDGKATELLNVHFNSNGEYPLHSLCEAYTSSSDCECDLLVMLKLLEAKGAKLDQMKPAMGHYCEKTPLCYATERGRALPFVRYLIEHGKNDATFQPEDENGALHRAVGVSYSNGMPVIRYLVEEAGADPKQLNWQGESTFYEACSQYSGSLSRLDVLRYLISKGVDPLLGSKESGTLFACMRGDNVDAALLLLDEFKADVDSVGEKQRPALVEALAQGSFMCAQMLISRGASLHKAGQDGRSAMFYLPNCNVDLFVRELEKDKNLLLATDAEGETIMHVQNDETYGVGCFCAHTFLEYESFDLFATNNDGDLAWKSSYGLSSGFRVLATAAIERYGDCSEKDKVRTTITASGCIPLFLQMLQKVDATEVNDMLQAAIEKENVGMVKHLLKAGASVADLDQECVSFDNADVLIALIDNGLDLNGTSGWREDPLLNRAVGEASVPAVRHLIEKGADVTLTNESGEGPLHALSDRSEAGIAEIALLLIEKIGTASPLAEDGETPLHKAAHEANVELAKVLLDNGADVEQADNEGNTPLHRAANAYRNAPRIVRFLVDQGADVRKADSNGAQAIHIGCKELEAEDLIEIVDFLVARGVDLQQPDQEGHVPLYYLCQNRNATLSMLEHVGKGTDVTQGDFLFQMLDSGSDQAAECAKWLIEHNASLTESDAWDGSKPIHKAATLANAEALRLILDAGIDIESAADEEQTPLHFACSHEDTKDCIELLIVGGANVSAVTAEGRGPLALACEHASENEVQVLLECDSVPLDWTISESPWLALSRVPSFYDTRVTAIAKVLLGHNLPPSDAEVNEIASGEDAGDRVRHLLAASVDFSGMMLRLIKDDVMDALVASADPNIRFGRTRSSLLHICAEKGNEVAVWSLFRRGSSPYLRNAKGKTALEVALEKQQEQIAEALVDAMQFEAEKFPLVPKDVQDRLVTTMLCIGKHFPAPVRLHLSAYLVASHFASSRA